MHGADRAFGDAWRTASGPEQFRGRVRPRRVSMDTEATRASGPEAYRAYVEDSASPAATKEGAKSARPN